MKTKEELDALKEEIETVGEKIKELTEEELAQVTGGQDPKWIQLYIGATLSLEYIATEIDETHDLK